MASRVSTLTVLGKRKSLPSRVGSVRLVGSTPEPSCSEQSDADFELSTSTPKDEAKPILINGKLSISTKLRYQCQFDGCDKVYTKPSRLAEHERTHTGDRPFVCETCEKAYLRESHLHAHIRSHLPESSRPLACDVQGCEKRFWTTQHLKAHQDWHNGTKPFACTEDGCSEAFSKHHQLRTHICETHAPPGTKPYMCDHDGCSKSFKTNQHLKTHKKTHDPERYICVHATCLVNSDETSNYYPTWSALQHHIRTAHPPTCNHPTCNGRIFASQKGFKAHLKLHEDEELESELRIHLESDADDDQEPLPKKARRGGEVGREWVCSFNGCNKDFKSKKSLGTHHNVTHLGKRAFVCSRCDKPFGYKHLLQRHTAKVHAKEDESASDDEDLASTTEAETEGGTTHIDTITGKAYATQADSNVRRGKALHCPFPDLGDLVSSVATTSTTRPCDYVYTRLYDLRRHLDGTHGIKTEKENLERWFTRKKRALGEAAAQ